MKDHRRYIHRNGCCSVFVVGSFFAVYGWSVMVDVLVEEEEEEEGNNTAVVYNVGLSSSSSSRRLVEFIILVFGGRTVRI